MSGVVARAGPARWHAFGINWNQFADYTLPERRPGCDIVLQARQSRWSAWNGLGQVAVYLRDERIDIVASIGPI